MQASFSSSARPARFITLEGGEGAGKSTLIRRLATAFADAGIALETTREPGGSEGAEQIRRLLVEGDPGRWDAISETLLHFAARRDHVEKRIKPVLASGTWVLCDRFADSSIAYQGYGHGLGPDFVRTLWRMTLADYRPDLTLVLDIAPEEGLGRTRRRDVSAEDRYERMDQSFHERLREGFREIARLEPDRCVLIDASRTVDEVFEAVRAGIAARLGVTL